MSLDITSWGFDRTSGLSNYLPMKNLTEVLIRTVRYVDINFKRHSVGNLNDPTVNTI